MLSLYWRSPPPSPRIIDAIMSTHGHLRESVSSDGSASRKGVFGSILGRVSNASTTGELQQQQQEPIDLPPFLRRFIIFHTGLLPATPDTGRGGSGKGIGGLSSSAAAGGAANHDESASVDELVEYVLYYFDSHRHAKRGRDRNMHGLIAPSEGEKQEAVRFAGLCTALRSLPRALRDATSDATSDSASAGLSRMKDANLDESAPGKRATSRAVAGEARQMEGDEEEDDDDDPLSRSSWSVAAANDDLAEEVRLDASTLVFIPLEEGEGDVSTGGEGLVAVAQVPRTLAALNSPRSRGPGGRGRRRMSDGSYGSQGPGRRGGKNASLSSINSHGEQSEMDPSGADPAAVRSMVRRCHDLFRLFRGGGANQRLMTDYDPKRLEEMLQSIDRSKEKKDRRSNTRRRGSHLSHSSDDTTFSFETNDGTQETKRRERNKAAVAAQQASLMEEDTKWAQRWKRASMIGSDTTQTTVDAKLEIAPQTPAVRRSSLMQTYSNYTGENHAKSLFLDVPLEQVEEMRAIENEPDYSMSETQQTVARKSAGIATDDAMVRPGRNSYSPERMVWAGYPGMDSLYALRRDLRKLEAKLTDRRIDAQYINPEDYDVAVASARKLQQMERAQHKLKRRIYTLSIEILPLGRLRADLLEHYDLTLLGATETTRSAMAAAFGPDAQNGVGRKLVESVPLPPVMTFRGIAAKASEHARRSSTSSSFSSQPPSFDGSRHCPPRETSTTEALALGKIVWSLVKETEDLSNSRYAVGKYGIEREGAVGPRIVSASAFHRGWLVLSHAAEAPAPYPSSEEKGDGAATCSFEIPPRTARLLFHYMTSRADCVDAPPPDRGNVGEWGRFLSPPDGIGMDSCLSLPPPNEDIWAPHVYLPIAHQEVENDKVFDTFIKNEDRREKDATDTGHTLPLRAILYDFLGGLYSFIILISPGQGVAERRLTTDIWSMLLSSSRNLSSSLQPLWEAKQGISPSIDGTPNPTNSSGPASKISSDGVVVLPPSYCGEQGMDLIYIDRAENNMVLLSREDIAMDDPHATAKDPKRGWVKWFGKNDENKTGMDVAAVDNLCSVPGMMDCRHLLASHLPLDVILALDEMFTEVHRLSNNGLTNVNDAKSGLSAEEEVPIGARTGEKVVEMCNFLPQGWVYARARGARELYLVFDTSIFITLADVHKTAEKVRETLFHGVL